MAKQVTQRRKSGLTKTALLTRAREWVSLDKEVKALSARKNEVRDQIKEWAEKFGEEDENGNGWLDLPEPVEDVTGFKRERVATVSLDPEGALAIVKSRIEYLSGRKPDAPLNRDRPDITVGKALELLQSSIKTVEVLDPDALEAASFVGAITDADLEPVTYRNVNYRLLPVRNKARKK